MGRLYIMIINAFWIGPWEQRRMNQPLRCPIMRQTLCRTRQRLLHRVKTALSN